MSADSGRLPVPSGSTPLPPAPPAEPPAAVPLQPGQVIDGFRLEERLHQGGMANLWRVTRVEPLAGVESAMPLLMKVPRIKGGEDPASIVGFEVEQMILPKLTGMHVPKYLARGDFSRQPYIVMEQIPGDTLRPHLEAAPLPFDEIADLGTRVATALHDLHRQHVVHLDVKPSNVLFRRPPDGSPGVAVLVDFGLSRHDLLPDLLEEEFTLPLGTGPYMSPEQVQFIRNDPRSDLFALGVMLYHFTTGERPFGAPSSVRGLRRRLYVEPVPPRSLRPDCPPWLQEVILRCLEVQADRRYDSAAQLAQDLQHPEQVTLTERAARLRTGGLGARMKRWFQAVGAEPVNTGSAAAQVRRSPIVMAAVDVVNAEPALLDQLRETVRRIVAAEPGARLACVSVLRTARLGMDDLTDAAGTSLHVKQLVGLKHWAHPLTHPPAAGVGGGSGATTGPGGLGLGEGRLTFHVLEAPDPAAALVEFAAKNQVDHIVMGARGTSTLRRYLGSVSAQVVAQAECTVTVVKALGA